MNAAWICLWQLCIQRNVKNGGYSYLFCKHTRYFIIILFHFLSFLFVWTVGCGRQMCIAYASTSCVNIIVIHYNLKKSSQMLQTEFQTCVHVHVPTSTNGIWFCQHAFISIFQSHVNLTIVKLGKFEFIWQSFNFFSFISKLWIKRHGKSFSDWVILPRQQRSLLVYK